MTDLAQSRNTAKSRRAATLFAIAVELLFLAYLAGACLVLTDFMDVNEPKWFLIRAAAPILLVSELLGGAWRRGRDPLRLSAAGGIAILFLAWHVMSTVVAVNVGRAWVEVSELAGLICSFMLTARFAADVLHRDRVLWTLTLIGTAVSIYGIAQHFGLDFMTWQENNEVLVSRGVSFFGHATFTASVLIQIIPIAIGLAATRRAWPARVLSGLAAGLMLYHVSFTGARMATLSLVLTGAAVGLWIAWRRWRALRERGQRSEERRVGKECRL